MNVQDIMTPIVELTDPQTTVRDVAQKMVSEDIGAIPVGENDRLIGMVTDRDIVVRAIAAERPLTDTSVRDVMSEQVYYCFEADDVFDAAKVMGEHQVRRLPVLNRDKRLVGLVSLADLCASGESAAQVALAGITQPSDQARH